MKIASHDWLAVSSNPSPHKYTMGRGRTSSYRHHGSAPVKPSTGWSTESLHLTNPPFRYLDNALRQGSISPHGNHIEIYNAHPELYSIDPQRFLRFFRNAVKAVLGIELGSEDTTASSSTLSLPSNSSSEASTLHHLAPSNMSNMNDASSYGDGHIDWAAAPSSSSSNHNIIQVSTHVHGQVCHEYARRLSPTHRHDYW